MHFDGHEAPDNPSEGTHRQHRWVSYYQAATTRWHDVRGRNYRVQMPACHACEIRRRHPDPDGQYTEGIIKKVHPDFQPLL